jgi:hypothetical protein
MHLESINTRIISVASLKAFTSSENILCVCVFNIIALEMKSFFFGRTGIWAQGPILA